MYINFDEVSREDFDISERELDGYGKVFLIKPCFGKHIWTSEDRHLRSLLCSPDGRVISSGFGKFHNYSEHSELDLITQQQILAGNAWFAEKMDGSLLIRSVLSNGKVHFRTRGSHTLGEGFKEPIEALILNKYPNLMDPTRDARYSILFEYTSPDNLIVIQYEDIKLTVLGMMDLSADPAEFVSSPELVRQLEADYGVPAVSFYNLKGGAEEVIEQIKGWKGREGVVVWCQLPDGKMHLTKIKASEYIRIHSLKFQLTSEKVKQICWYKDIDTLDKLKEEFHRLGVDWEAISFVEPIFDEYAQRKAEVTAEVTEFIKQILDEKVEELGSRKLKALKLKEMAGSNRALFSVGMQYILGNKDLGPFIDSITLGISIKRIKNFRKEAKVLSEYIDSKI